MINLLLSSQFVFGNEYFGLNMQGYHPALYVFGYPIYLYALCIVTGMSLAIWLSGVYFQKRGYDPYDVTVYALFVIPLGVLGARAYIYIFPWADGGSGWETFFNFRSGGLGIYGGVIVGYIVGFIVSKAKKHNFRIASDCAMPGVMLAQSIGRWGNYFNQEAYGRLITTAYDALPHAESGLFSNFNGYAVWIDSWHANSGAGWYQATFFYESACNLLGFLFCIFVLARSKRYKIGWCTAFYGIYYGIVRLVIEGMRTDSLYLYVGDFLTDIKISQLVSVVTITLGVVTLSQIYRKDIHNLYKKFFKDDYHELQVSKYLLIGLSAVLLAVAIVMFSLGGESKFMIGAVLALLAVYSALGSWSIFDRLQIYCPTSRKAVVPSDKWQTEYQKLSVATIVYAAAMVALFCFALFSLFQWGIAQNIDNGIVLAVICLLVVIAIAIFAFVPTFKKLLQTKPTQPESTFECDCGATHNVKLNKFLLFVFPAKVYKYHGVEHIKPWVDPEKLKKQQQKEQKQQQQNQQ